ncbi:MAG: hypothetical protein BWY11_01992 [Firmicutes bacterium ADurb.Bin182]|nr:MAG: hypothetical protein BWY11_01992 [Firmicutes bacterium ADurb.Bin182]
MAEPDKNREMPETFDRSGASRCFYNQLPKKACDRLIANGLELFTYEGLTEAAREIESCD